MTEAAAHQFIERSRRIVYPWRGCTEAQAAHGMLQMSGGLMIGMFSTLVVEISQTHFDMYNRVVFSLLALCGFGFFLWLNLKTRQARRALGYLPIVNHKS